jgi:hypothetical protein
MTALRLTALRRSRGPTISRMKAWRAGFSKVLLSPRMTASSPTSHTWTTWVVTRTPSTRAWRPIIDCRKIISFRLSTRSATTPPYAPSKRTGSACRATIRPRSTLEWVRVRISQDWAVVCIQVPIREMACPLT